MADSEMVVTETSTAVDSSSTGYTSTGYGDFVSNAASGHTQYAADASGGAVNAVYATMAGGDGSAYAVDGSSVVHVASHGEVNKTGENVGAGETATGYNSSVNGNVGNGTEGVTAFQNGTTDVVSSGAAAEQQYSEGSALSMSGEEDRLWNIVKANSLDFDAWTRLIDETEKVAADNILKIRKVYDAFLAEFPLCYGYWKKYADHEQRLGSIEKVVEVYERAVLGVTYSVDIWLHYCTFVIHTYGDPETVQSLFERGLAYVGTDYFSYLLWDKYIEYEEMQAAWSRVATIYTRILEIPNKQLDDYLNRFKGLAATRPLAELRTAEEAATATTTAPVSEDRDQSSEGGDHAVDAEHSSEHVSAGATEAEEMEKYVSIREEIYRRTKEFDSKICDFENAIRRPYFHVKPLNIIELENWHNYLDFIEGEGVFSKVVKLYERCLIACANYPEYWIRYVLSMEASGSMDLATNALTRATQVFVKRRPEIHLFAARFREQNGDITGARAAYQLLHTEIAPGLCEAVIKHANMEHRLGNQQDAFSLYEQAIAIEKGKEQSQVLPMFYAQYSRFVYLVSGNAEKARVILDDALQNVQLSKPLLEALIHLESLHTPPKRIDYLDSLVEKFIVPISESSVLASAGEKEELSSIFLEFLDLFGDAQIIKKAADRHTKLFFPHKNKSDYKKRPAEDYLTSDKAKLANTASPAQGMVGAQPNAQNQWAAGYGVQPQAWPAATQPWTPAAYTQPATYGAYGAYGTGYTAPQVPAPVTQTATYATYPPTYPAQAAYPQQSYAQPTAAAAVAPAQQPVAVPQPYYGTTTYY